MYRLCERLYLQVQPLCRIVSAFGFGPLFFGFRHDVPDLFQRERCRVGIFRDAVVFAAGCDVGTVTAVQYLYLRFGIEDLDGLFRCLGGTLFFMDKLYGTFQRDGVGVVLSGQRGEFAVLADVGAVPPD